jgi:NADPH:quinone reductase-like Zn-dependent oxidoreductase
MSSIRAVFADPNTPDRLAIREVAAPTPTPAEAVVSVAAVSLNRGETRRALETDTIWRPGWDLAGIVEQPAADGSGPRAGARVVGLLRTGAWAERVAVPTHALAELPASVSFAQASTLPVAGLTALYALQKGGTLLNRVVLITGATGGVGDFAIQLARLSGARVVAHVRRAEQVAEVKQAGADEVMVGDDLSLAPKAGPYDLIIDSVGGKTLGAALSQLAKGGVCVSLGASAGAEVTFDARSFFPIGRTSLYGFILFEEFGNESAAVGLARLAALIAAGKLQPRISLEAPWTQIADVARQLLNRRFPGKAVLHVSAAA